MNRVPVRAGQRRHESDNKVESERAEYALALAAAGRRVAVVSSGDPGVFAMAMFALIGLGFGFIIRNGAGAIAATVGVLFVLPIVLNMFVFAGESWQWIVDLGQYLPMAAAQMATTPAGDDVLRGILTLAAWPAALLLGAWAALRTRDA